MSVPIFDSHLDLAANALMLDRDLLLPLDELAASEAGMTDLPYRAKPTISLPELRRADVRLCSPTILARLRPEIRKPTGIARFEIDYTTPEAVHAMGMAQVAYYELLESRGEVEIIRTSAGLSAFVAGWGAAPFSGPVGCILSMEGADPILSPGEASVWWERGLRFASLVHYGEGRYAGGTGASLGVTAEGRELLAAFERLGLILDLTHLSDAAFLDALDAFSGPVLASHNNCRAIVPGSRQFSDEQIRLIVERGGVIGVACDAWMLYPGWERGVTRPDVLSLASLVDHIDHICSIAGNASHVAIGSDLDGLYGWEQTPGDLKSIVGLQKLPELLTARGYPTTQIDDIMHGNWIRFFGRHLPANGG